MARKVKKPETQTDRYYESLRAKKIRTRRDQFDLYQEVEMEEWRKRRRLEKLPPEEQVELMLQKAIWYEGYGWPEEEERFLEYADLASKGENAFAKYHADEDRYRRNNRMTNRPSRAHRRGIL